ncbi:hypothetical protein FHG87_009812 [Trinorchestia longiramus]|nr:hypothetical protein FHG87_009812 [Trinorchestia longiramus]
MKLASSSNASSSNASSSNASSSNASSSNASSSNASSSNASSRNASSSNASSSNASSMIGSAVIGSAVIGSAVIGSAVIGSAVIGSAVISNTLNILQFSQRRFHVISVKRESRSSSMPPHAGYRQATGRLQAGYRQAAGRLQAGCRQAAGRLQAGCRQAAGRLQAGGTLQFACFPKAALSSTRTLLHTRVCARVPLCTRINASVCAGSVFVSTPELFTVFQCVQSSVSRSGPYCPPGGVEEIHGGGRRVRLEWGAYITV